MMVIALYLMERAAGRDNRAQIGEDWGIQPLWNVGGIQASNVKN